MSARAISRSEYFFSTPAVGFRNPTPKHKTPVSPSDLDFVYLSTPTLVDDCLLAYYKKFGRYLNHILSLSLGLTTKMMQALATIHFQLQICSDFTKLCFTLDSTPNVDHL